VSGAPEPVGTLLARLRRARGWSQPQLAGRLCDASGRVTLARSEVSRWERGRRIPGSFWLGWLAVVLEAPLDRLEAAVEAARGRCDAAHAPAQPHRLWRAPSAADLLAALDHGNAHEVRDLAHSWLAGPPDPAYPDPAIHDHPYPDPAPPARTAILGAATARDALAALDLRLGRLRRIDDQLGGLDLAGPVDRELREAVAVLRTLGAGRLRRRAVRVVAGYAQLAGWAHADAGDGPAACRAHRVGLLAASAARDRPLAAYVLASLSHHRLAVGAAQEALELARTGYAGVRAGGSPLTRALLLHRIALAAAHLGERRPAEAALVAAQRAADRAEPGREPDWLYWLDAGELAAMTGRCLAALGRPARAVRLLPGRTGAGPRTAALYASWLARCLLALGEVELACGTAVLAYPKAVAAGSARALTALRHLHPLLLRHRDLPAVRRYQQVAAATASRVRPQR
jgi:transcriptional regulator with XRE-family HTH domain